MRPEEWEALERENLEGLEELLHVCIYRVDMEGRALKTVLIVGNRSIFDLQVAELRGELLLDGIPVGAWNLGEPLPLPRQSIREVSDTLPLDPGTQERLRRAGDGEITLRLRGRFEGRKTVEKVGTLRSRLSTASRRPCGRRTTS
jgi:hypothetical protein